jgi:hypothetical protein
MLPTIIRFNCQKTRVAARKKKYKKETNTWGPSSWRRMRVDVRSNATESDLSIFESVKSGALKKRSERFFENEVKSVNTSLEGSSLSKSRQQHPLNYPNGTMTDGPILESHQSLYFRKTLTLSP